MQQDSDVQKKPTLFSLIDLIFLLNSKVLHFFFMKKWQIIQTYCAEKR